MGFFVLFIAPIVGTIIAEAARGVTKRRRSPQLFTIVAVGAFFGSLPFLIRDLFFGLSFHLLWQGIYTFTVTSTAYYRIKGVLFSR
jgi:hypothetical protein